MEEEKRQYLIDLYDLYGLLLTDKQRLYFEDYYFMDLSITEMAENYEISRNAVHDQLKRTVSELEDYEDKLQLQAKFQKLSQIECDEAIKSQITDILWED